MSTEIELRPVDYSKSAAEEAAAKLKQQQLESSSPSSPSANDSTVSASSDSPSSSPNAMNGKQHKSKRDHHHKKEKRDHHGSSHYHHHNTSVHQYDSKIMGGFYEACVAKLSEVYPSWTETWQMKEKPLFMSTKHVVHDRMIKLIQESQEPAIVLQNFDYGDILNFERFLQMLKQDGVNSISKFKQYLANKDMKKLDLDLVIIHAKYGILLVDIKECDYLDSKKRSKAKVNLSNARQSVENLVKLIVDAKGLNQPSPVPTQPAQPTTVTTVGPDGVTTTTTTAPVVATPTKPEPSLYQIPISEIIALPNLIEKPQQAQQQQQQQQQQTAATQQQQQSPRTATANLRQLSYIVKSDLESSDSFKKWWSETVVERLEQRQIKDSTLLNHLVGMLSCIRNNSILPVVRKELDLTPTPVKKVEEPKVESAAPTAAPEQQPTPSTESTTTAAEKPTEKYKLSVSGEFFHEKHESVRSQSRVVVSTKDEDRVKRTVCMQILWLLLNDSQKKISVVCSEANKAFYEEYFKLQRKLYNNLNNVRFYSDLQSCAINGTSHTLRKDGEIWFFDCDSKMSSTLSKDVIDRMKELNAFWVYTQDTEWTSKNKAELDTITNVKLVNLDPQATQVQHRDGSLVTHVDIQNKPWVDGLHLKFPLRLSCDLLVIGDIVTPNQLKYLLRNFKNGGSGTNGQQNGGGYQQHHQQQHHQHSQAAKRLKTIKFIRGGTIDNIRESIKMHDSIQAQVVLMHVGDEDVFKTRNSQTTIDRVKELTQLVKEYCPKSFIVLSTLMRRASKTENTMINDVNKGIIQFCKQARDSSNFFYMLNNHFDPEYHTYEGRVLSNKGLKLYVDNILFVVDYFLVKNNKQH